MWLSGIDFLTHAFARLSQPLKHRRGPGGQHINKVTIDNTYGNRISCNVPEQRDDMTAQSRLTRLFFLSLPLPS